MRKLVTARSTLARNIVGLILLATPAVACGARSELFFGSAVEPDASVLPPRMDAGPDVTVRDATFDATRDSRADTHRDAPQRGLDAATDALDAGTDALRDATVDADAGCQFLFESPVAYAVDTVVQTLVVTDLNRDGIADLFAFGLADRIADAGGNGYPPFAATATLLGQLGGTFLALPKSADDVGKWYSGVLVTDLDGDGVADLLLEQWAVGGPGEGAVGEQVRLGLGDGTFGVASAPSPPIALDGVQASNVVALAAPPPFMDGVPLFGVGEIPDAGSLAPPLAPNTYWWETLMPASPSPQILRRGSVQADAGDAGSIRVNPLVSSWPPVRADFNGDGQIDALVGLGRKVSLRSFMQVLLAQSDGSFAAAALTPYPPGTEGSANPFVGNVGGPNPLAPVVADFNGDGTLDLVLIAGSSIVVLPGRGDGTFGAPVITPDALPAALAVVDTFAGAQVVAADIDGDGHTDLATVYLLEPEPPGVPDGSTFPANGLVLSRGHGDGTFEPSVTLASGAPDTYLTVETGSFFDDGRVDLAVGGLRGDRRYPDYPYAGTVWIFKNRCGP